MYVYYKHVHIFKFIDWVLQETLTVSTKWPARITSIGAQSENNYIGLLKFEFLPCISLLKIMLGKYLAKMKKKISILSL